MRVIGSLWDEPRPGPAAREGLAGLAARRRASLRLQGAVHEVWDYAAGIRP